jgi:PAS domain S-box-containing protein
MAEADPRDARIAELERKLAELTAASSERPRLEAALLARELQTLTDNSPDILTRFDRQMRHVFVNAAVERVTGVDRSTVLGKTNRELGMPPAICDAWERALASVFERGEPCSIELEVETPSGRRCFVSRLIPERGDSGEVEHALGITHDVTEQKQAAQALIDADRRKDEFLATLAHELRNPLAPIRNGLEILRRYGAENETVERVQDMMARQLSHLVRLVDDLLDVSRISRGMVELRPERVELRTILEHAVETSRPRIEAGRHVLAVQAPTAPVWVDGDLTRLAQVVSNLLHNAAKYTPSGGRIRLSAGLEDDQASSPAVPMAFIRVTDDGIGIAPEMLPNVFGLFAQVDRTLHRTHGGLGIGLSLARNLVELHGGTITAESSGLGHGSTFTVRLPAAVTSATLERHGSRRSANDDTIRRVLVVDDNTDGAQSLALLLELSGHEASTANSGPAALQAAKAWRPELVFLDIGMPGMDGYEVIRRLRADPATAELVVVALTGWGSAADKRKSKDAGFDMHLVKPVRPEDVADVLARYPSLRRAE